jgi:hypothetical protein
VGATNRPFEFGGAAVHEKDRDDDEERGEGAKNDKPKPTNNGILG